MRKLISSFIVLLLSFVVVSCGKNALEDTLSGGGSGGQSLDDLRSAPQSVPGALTGTAATGAPVANAAVKIKCNNGTIPDGLTDAFGKWSMDVEAANCDGPYIIRVVGISGGESIDLISVAANEDVGNIVNVSPISHIISAGLLGEANPVAAFALIPSFNKVQIDGIKEKIKSKLAVVIQAATGKADISDVDLLNAPFATDHTGLDAVLDVISLDIVNSKNINIEVVGGNANTAIDLDVPATLETAVDANESQIQSAVDNYASVDSLLIGLINYVQSNANAINAAQSTPQLPAGYLNYYHPNFKDRGFDAHGALHEWFGLSDMADYNEYLGNSLAAFSNVRIELATPSSTEGFIIFDFILDGELQERGISLQVKKENNLWRLYGDQVNFDYHISSQFERKGHYDQVTATTTIVDQGMFGIWIEENSNIGNFRFMQILAEDGSPIAEIDLSEDNEEQDFNGDPVVLDNASGTYIGGGFYYDLEFAKLDTYAQAKIKDGFSFYTIQLTDVAMTTSNTVDGAGTPIIVADGSASPSVTQTIQLSLYSPNSSQLTHPVITYSNAGDSSTYDINFNVEGTIAEFCGNNAMATAFNSTDHPDDTNVIYDWDSANASQTVSWLYDSSELEYQSYGLSTSNGWDGDWENSALTSVNLDLSNFDQYTSYKEFKLYFRNINDIEQIYYLKCGY